MFSINAAHYRFASETTDVALQVSRAGLRLAVDS
jgi:hypothetical protein